MGSDGHVVVGEEDNLRKTRHMSQKTARIVKEEKKGHWIGLIVPAESPHRPDRC